MKTWFGSYSQSRHDVPEEATVLVSEKGVNIGIRRGERVVTHFWKLKDVEVSFDRSAQASRILHQPDQSLVMVEGNDAFDFLTSLQAEDKQPWHKKNKAKDAGRILTFFSIIAAILVLAYFLLVPWLAGKLATTVSVETEESFGNTIYDALGVGGDEDKASEALVNRFYMAMDVKTDYNIRISVIKGETVNAFALPGGHIVIYSALLKKLDSYPELAALISHEFTHVNNQHSTKSIFRSIGSKVFIGLLLGRMGSVSAVLADRADELKSLNYSRSLEKEADLDGLKMLGERNIDPAGFEGLFKSLKAESGRGGAPEFLASHPDIDKRIEYIRAAAVGMKVETNVALQEIFNQLKTIVK